MDATIKAFFENKYPYTALTHLNGRSSNLPGLMIIGLPFYLLGDIGFLQSFSLLFFAFVLFRTLRTWQARLLGILLLIFSISFLWEMYVKSDLMSNFILLMGFVIFLHEKNKTHGLYKPLVSGILTGLLLLTRIVAIIPLTILFIQPFLQSSLRKRLWFFLSIFTTAIVLSLLLIRLCPDYDTFIHYNPLLLQNKQLPFIISFLFILLPFFFFKKYKTLNHILSYCILFLSLPVFSAFTISLVKYGFNNIVYESAFDISYFNILMPFLIYSISEDIDKKEIKAG
ncbi:MAG: hypothetical protein GXO83_10805 [Chlorobi bacterium]|nr:hypothetical protein [Chlorobiota bacterium]